MAGICADLERMLSVVDGFHKFLGPQLKAVTGEPEAIDAVISRVAAMAAAVQNVEFDVFDKRFFADWSLVASNFTGEKEAIERSAKVFIDASFKKLRSAEDAFDLLQSFKSIKSEGAIGKTMADKFNDILEQFTREIVETQEMFDAQHEDPPVLSNQPPVAGSITWSRGLFSRIRKTMNRLQADAAESMKKEPAAAMCLRKYTDLAKAAMKYEKRLYGTWVEGADAVALVRLKEPVLRTGRPESGEDAETSGEAEEPSAEDHVVVNFHPELIALLRESRYLDRMGFAIPETTLKVALQEDKFNACRQALYEMLQRYRAAVDRLSEVERSLFSEKLRELRAVLEPGYNPLNWMSLGILEFVETCDFAINEFSSLVNQVQKTAGVVAAAVNDISTASAVVEPPAGDEVLDLLEAMEFFERHRTELCNRLARKYRSIGPLLGKVEEAVAGTNTGKSAQLRGYYHHWEKAIFFALNDLVLNSLDVIARLFDERAPGRRPGASPLFKIHVILNAPDIVVQPSPRDIAKFLGAFSNNVLGLRQLLHAVDGRHLPRGARTTNGRRRNLRVHFPTRRGGEPGGGGGSASPEPQGAGRRLRGESVGLRVGQALVHLETGEGEGAREVHRGRTHVRTVRGKALEVRPDGERSDGRGEGSRC